MATSDRSRECRINNKLTQAELAERLFVSRQAVSKWESGKGTPDIDNLTSMARLFGVSVDYLLDDGSQLAPKDAVVRVPIDVSSLEPSGGRFSFQRSKANTAVRQVYPEAVIWQLARRRVNTKSQEGMEWLNSLLFDGPFNIFATADGVSNRDAYYFVEDHGKQLVVRVGSEFVEARIFTGSNAEKFRIG